MHLVQQIGEAARVLTPEFKEQFPGIEWRAIIAMRNISALASALRAGSASS
jgi:uncharacterized protein with HEPN domain